MNLDKKNYRQWLRSRREVHAAEDFEQAVMLGIEARMPGHGYFVLRRLLAAALGPLAAAGFLLRSAMILQALLLMQAKAM